MLIPAGEFEMGSEGAEAFLDEQPIHTVYVDAFYMDTHVVTNLDYKKVCSGESTMAKTSDPDGVSRWQIPRPLERK